MNTLPASHTTGRTTYRSFVKKEYKKGYVIPGLDYQQNGILSKPLWTSRDQIIRIIPGYDTATGEVFHQNINCNEYAQDAPAVDYLSDTFRLETIVQQFGESQQTFITSYAPGSVDEQKYGRDSVISQFAKNVIYSVNSKYKPKFGVTNEMRRWVDPREGALRSSRPAVLMQALVFKANGRYNETADKQPLVDEAGQPLPQLEVVAIDSAQTINIQLNALVEPQNPGLPLDASSNNKYGGLAELDGNLLYLNPVEEVIGKKSVKILRPSVQEAGKGWTPTPFPLSEADVKAWWHPWADLLSYMTAEEQCQLLAAEFGAEAVNYLIGTDPLFRDLHMPEEIAARGYGQYAQFTDGVKEVAQTVRVSTPKVAAVRSIQRPQPPQAAAVAQTPAMPKPGGSGSPLPKRPSLGSVMNTSSTPSQLQARLNSIRAATQVTVDEQADVAQSLLDDPDVQADMDEQYDAGSIGL